MKQDKLKKILPNNIENKLFDSMQTSDLFTTNSKKCKLCNKSFSGNNKAYGTSCLKNLYDKSSIDYFKEIDDKELFLYTSIAFKLKKKI